MTSRARYTFSVQPLSDAFSRFAVRLFVEAFWILFANDERPIGALRPRPEDAVLDEYAETLNEFQREGDRNRLSIAAHPFM